MVDGHGSDGWKEMQAGLILACLLVCSCQYTLALDDLYGGFSAETDSSQYYADKYDRPEKGEGIFHEMKRMIQNVEDYSRNDLVDPDAQQRVDDKLAARKNQKVYEIPLTIWQTHGEERTLKLHTAYSQTWANENEGFRHIVCNREAARALVKEHYSELLDAYDQLSPTCKQDLWAYLMLFKFGGIFAAIDTTCERPIKDLLDTSDDMLVCMQPRLDSKVLARKAGIHHHTWPLQHWFMASKAGHPILRFLIDYIMQNMGRKLCVDNDDIDDALRTGAAPFNDAIIAFKKNKVLGFQLRIAKIGACGLGQVWGRKHKVTVPCAKERHGYGFWFDNNGNKHMCDCPTRKDRARRMRGQKESPCFVRRRHIEGAGVKSLVRYAERTRRRWTSRGSGD